MENKQKVIIGAVIGAVLLAGIGIGNSGKTDSSSNSGSNSQIEPAPAPEPVYTDEDYFITEVRSSGNRYVDNASDYDLLDIGRQTCSLLDDGYTIDDIITYLVANNDSNSTSFLEFEGIVIGAAVRNLCPEYTNQIP